MSDLYVETTARIVAALEKGVAPWVRPWSTGVDSIPTNACTRRPYRGINVVTLAMEAQPTAIARNRWLTYRQAAASAAQVRKGEHGTQVVFWKLREVEGGRRQAARDPAAALLHRVQHGADRRPAARVAEPLPSVPAWAGDEVAGATDRRVGGGHPAWWFRAFYAPGSDYIQIPPRPTFATASGYYATTLHELVHWTAPVAAGSAAAGASATTRTRPRN